MAAQRPDGRLADVGERVGQRLRQGGNRHARCGGTQCRRRARTDLPGGVGQRGGSRHVQGRWAAGGREAGERGGPDQGVRVGEEGLEVVRGADGAKALGGGDPYLAGGVGGGAGQFGDRVHRHQGPDRLDAHPEVGVGEGAGVQGGGAQAQGAQNVERGGPYALPAGVVQGQCGDQGVAQRVLGRQYLDQFAQEAAAASRTPGSGSPSAVARAGPVPSGVVSVSVATAVRRTAGSGSVR